MRSIRTQFYTFLAVLLVILLLLLNSYPILSAKEMVFEEKKKTMTAQAGVITASLAALDVMEENAVSGILQKLDIRDYDCVIVTDGSGAVLFEDGGTSSRLETEAVRSALGGNPVFRSTFTKNGFYSTYVSPLYREGQVRGAVFLRDIDKECAHLVLDIQAQLWIMSGAIVALTLLTAVLFTTGLLRRIRALVSSMRVVASGDYTHRHAVTGRDEIAELGEEFNNLTLQLQMNEKQRRQFVADASHELKTPLASIRLMADSIVESENMDVETMREFVTDIGTEANRLQRTTEKLLDLSRLDDGVQVIPEPVDMKQVAKDALALLRPLAAERQIRVYSRLEEGCVVMATTDDMFHIIFNLIENAIKYNMDGGEVHIQLDGNEENIRLEVADTGIGIPEAERLNIFGRFYRIDKARSREAGGSGLGLSIVHDAVIAHGGTVAVGTNKPQGSLFVVEFPRPKEGETGI